MAHMIRALRHGYCIERLPSSSSSRASAYSLAQTAFASEPDITTDLVSTISSSGNAFEMALEDDFHAVSNSVKKMWPQDRGLDKLTSSQVLSVRRLFNLVRQKRFEEMLMVHDDLAEREKKLQSEFMNVYLYTRLMTTCSRVLGPRFVLPVFERMLQAGVVPNVIPYTILVSAFMNAGMKADEEGMVSASALHGPLVSRAIELLAEMRSKGVLPNWLTYKPIISWLAASGDVTQFWKLEKWMQEDGVPRDGVFTHYAIKNSLRARDFKRARVLYLASKKRKLTMAGSMDAWFLKAFSENDEISVVLDLLPEVLLTISSTSSVSMALRCLARHGHHEAALQCFSTLRDKGTSGEQMGFYLNSYVLGLATCNKLSNAISAFREVEAAYQVKGGACVFNVLIDICCRMGKITLGLDFLDEMQQRGLELSPFSFNPFIREFSHWTMFDEAFEMKAAMIRLGVQPTVVTYNSLVTACVKLGDLVKAHNLLAEMKGLGLTANAHCYNPLIMGFATQGRFDRALALVNDMHAAGVKPDVHTYRLLIFACSVIKNKEKAEELFKQMQESGIKPNQSIYTVMAIVYGRCGNLDHAIEMVKDIKNRGEAVSTEAKSAILSGLALAGRLTEAFAMYEEIKQEGVLPHAYAVGSLMAAVGKVGDLDRMFEIFEESRGDNLWTFMKMSRRQRAEHLNIRCINVVLGCIWHNQLGRAINFLQMVKQEGIADERVLFDKIFLHISNGGQDENEMCWLDVDDGFAVVSTMRELGLRPSRMALEALLDGCAAMNDSEQAQRVLREMEREGLRLNIFSMVRLFRAYVAGEDEERALALLDEMPLSDLEDRDVRILLLQTLQPHYVAAADSPEAAQAPETLPRVRQRVDELIGGDLIPGTAMAF